MKIVVIEGLDGAGKSTQIELLTRYLEQKGIRSRYLHFPRTEAPFYGELIARFLRGEFGTAAEVDPYLVAMLYAGDRHDAASMLEQWTSDGYLVLLDRYTYSNIAYQCAKINDPVQSEKLRKWILDLEFLHFGIPVPDINIFLDVPFSFTENKLRGERDGNDRSYLNGTSDIHEADISFQMRVRDAYIGTAAADGRLTILNCSSPDGGMMTPQEIFALIVDLLYEKNLLE